MNYWDWIVIVVYITVIIGIALYLTRYQRDIKDYYLAGKRVKWWQSGMSTMATQFGAISFVSAPAFVALKKGGGMKWLCYEFGVPLALILVMANIIPTLHRGKYISIYEYMEVRFDSTSRSLVSLLFQLGRGLATAVSVLAGGIILSTALSISTTWAIILVGAVTIIYDVLGGIRVVILSDVLQMIIIIAGIVVCGIAALHLAGWEFSWTALPPERFKILDFKHWGVSQQGEYAFWPMVLGGIFLYASYYGCDQSQVQRELTVGDTDGVRKSLLINALGRFPLVLLYCLLGILVGVVMISPESLSHVASVMQTDANSVSQVLQDDPDRMLPLFIISYLPHGLIGFIFVAIMSALMSSLDSGLNSLSAVTIRDFYQKYIKKEANEKHYLLASKICTMFWGLFCVLAAIAFANIGEATRQTTIVLINAIGSLLYGPILASFLLGMMTRWVTSRAIKTGIIAGILVNIYFLILTPLSWMWWNLTGFVAVLVVAAVFSIPGIGERKPSPFQSILDSLKEKSSERWRRIYILIFFYFFFIIIISFFLERLI